jgi:elongation factor P--(R)-beta-lysine ligase
MTDPSPWWDPSRRADRRPFLAQRGRITRTVRRWFEVQRFEEVETTALQIAPGAEVHLHAFATEAVDIAGGRKPRYLHTSPEFDCKKLLASGEPRIFTLAKVWRNRERSRLHSPEFTMLEWYRADEPYEALMADCAAILAQVSATSGATTVTWRAREAELDAEPERLTVAEAFERHARMDVFGDLPEQARALGVRVAADDTWSDVFAKVMVERIEPVLGLGRPTILCEYPVSEAALARPTATDPRVAERFELYVCGVELANGFGELTDPVEQRRRFEVDQAEKARRYGETWPLDEDLLAALAHMPPASGCALGFDRLVMLATGAGHIEQVLWTPVA